MTTATPPESALNLSSAEVLNRDCFCRTLNKDRLRAQLEADPSLQGLTDKLLQTRSNLFSSNVVFVSKKVQSHIESVVEAIERVATLPGYQAQALSRALPIAQPAWGPRGACMGYDFHLSHQGPQLIEINTNAGGLLLNAALARAQEVCCKELGDAFVTGARQSGLPQAIFDMFAAEWQLQRGDQPWRSVLIVDSAPKAQYLAPEFELFRQLFAQHGLQAHIADPAELVWQGGQLLYQNTWVDMVYNRLTDFYLEEPAHQALRQAYEAGAVVLTPHPNRHALLADKRNLIALSNDTLLTALGASTADRKLLAASVPTTRLVTQERADELWAQRRQLFFKPVAGYGAKAAYRGDKLTRRVWGEILQGDFVAQTLVPPAERMIEVDGVLTDLKFDIRAFTYGGRVQLLAARIYSGQTTNFRTPGGGFAPVIVVSDEETR
ncbi:ATP-grasp domain-containing protein [Rhodoferax antarcticus]|uniref:hypothetical protein n=1 Tax=Rhodoferax antarcticus TaxID=81479 RepID=UPI0022257F70|nr:hypothetical protein [Rhodoferax antarcticus]MCW2310305.1 hypothetical protein [Rhodoferax antarcticus]